MIETWKILESEKGRTISLPADWCKNLDEPRTSRDVMGDPFHPQNFTRPAFQEFSVGSSRELHFVGEKLTLPSRLEHVGSYKSRDARTPEEDTVLALQVKVVPWESQEQSQEAGAKGTLAKFTLGCERLRRAPGSSCPDRHPRARATRRGHFHPRDWTAHRCLASLWGTCQRHFQEEELAGGQAPSRQPLSCCVCQRGRWASSVTRRSMPSSSLPGARQSPHSAVGSPGGLVHENHSFWPWAGAPRLRSSPWAGGDSPARQSATFAQCGSESKARPHGDIGACRTSGPLRRWMKHEGREDTHVHPSGVSSHRPPRFLWVYGRHSCRCPVFLNSIMLCDFTARGLKACPVATSRAKRHERVPDKPRFSPQRE